ncbi:MAG: hypothetical protein AABY86_09050, partial [Bdellovibrionota bacterium]
DYSREITAIKDVLAKSDQKNFRLFGLERVAQNPYNADILDVVGGIVFLNTTVAETQVMDIGNGKTQLVLQHSPLQLADTRVVERPEIFKIILASRPIIYFIGVGLLLFFGCYYLLKKNKKKRTKKNSRKSLGPNIQSKADVESLYSYLIDEIKYQEMPMSQKNKYNELIEKINEVQYKRNITSEELDRIETRLLEIQKEQNGNRI